MSKKVTRASVYDPHTQVKGLLKALIFGTCKTNMIIYSQMRFQLYQSLSLIDTGLKSGKNPILGLCRTFRDLTVTFKLMLQTSNLSDA